MPCPLERFSYRRSWVAISWYDVGSDDIVCVKALHYRCSCAMVGSSEPVDAAHGRRGRNCSLEITFRVDVGL